MLLIREIVGNGFLIYFLVIDNLEIYVFMC